MAAVAGNRHPLTIWTAEGIYRKPTPARIRREEREVVGSPNLMAVTTRAAARIWASSDSCLRRVRGQIKGLVVLFGVRRSERAAAGDHWITAMAPATRSWRQQNVDRDGIEPMA